MIDLYKILEIDPSKSLTEIQDYLDRNRTIWENNAHNRGDAESIQKVNSLKEADIIFSSQVNRDRYDKELHKFLNPAIQADPREVRCLEYTKRAEEYIRSKEFDLAEKAINQAMAYREDDNIKVLKMAAHISDCLNNTGQALNYINEAIVIKPEDQQNYKLKLLILLHDFDMAKQAKYIDNDKLTQKIEVTRQYILEGFIKGMNPQSDREYLDTCDFILNSIKKMKHGFDFLPSIRYGYKNNYRKKALSVREEKYYRMALSRFWESSSDILLDLDALQYCKSILRQSPNSQIAKEYFQRYERRAAEERFLQKKLESDLHNLIKKQKQLETTTSYIRTDIKRLEDTNEQLWKARSESSKRRDKLSHDTQGGILTQLIGGVVFYGIYLIFFIVVGLILSLLKIIEIRLELIYIAPLIMSVVRTFLNIKNLFEISQLKKQEDSLLRQMSENSSKKQSLEEDLRKKERLYEQIKLDIDRVSDELRTVKQTKI